jgi:ABC-2 type transport system ATP-binding protein
MPIVEVDNLAKNYGRIQALKGVSLKVEKGEVFGLLGRNGAGKTTLIKILLGICRPTGGIARMFDVPINHSRARDKTGYLPEDHRLPEYHTPQSLLTLSGRLYGISKDERRIDELLELVGLTEWRKTKIRKFSKGMKQRLGLAQAIYHNPDLIFLDEPTDGVDPVGRREIREIISRLKEQGKTIFINSHLLSEVEKTCNRVGIIDAGLLIREGNMQDIIKIENVFEINFSGNIEPFKSELTSMVKSSKSTEHGLEIQVQDKKEIDKLIDFLRAKNISITGVQEKKQTLEDVFIEAIEK